MERAADVIEFARMAKFVNLSWRLLALRSSAWDALGDTEQASADREEARTVLAQVIGNISDAKLRRCYESSALAQGLLTPD